MRLFKFKVDAVYERHLEHEEESDDQMRGSFDSLSDAKYTHHRIRITEVRKNTDLLNGVCDKIKDAMGVLDALGRDIPGNKTLFKGVDPETVINLADSPKYLVEKDEVELNVVDLGLPREYCEYVAVREGIRGLYTEQLAFNGIRCAIEKHYKQEFVLSEDKEQNPTVCYHLEQWLAEQGEELDDRYTVEL